MKKMYKMKDKNEEQFKRAEQIIENAATRLEKYKKDREEMPADSDGIYIILSGECICVNRFGK